MKVLSKQEVAALESVFRRVRSDDPPVPEYIQFVRALDRRIAELVERHREHLHCGPGCHSCCHVERSVLPLEAYVLWREFQRQPFPLQDADPESPRCAALIRGLCALYEVRPVLCRTHGLPLVYEIGGEKTVTYCPLNFVERTTPHFTPEEVLDMDEVNAELVRMNLLFVRNHLPPEFHAVRVRLRDLFGGPP